MSDTHGQLQRGVRQSLGWALLVLGIHVGALASDVDAQDRLWWNGGSQGRDGDGWTILAAGDLDGDGSEDAAIFAPAWPGGQGSASRVAAAVGSHRKGDPNLDRRGG